jgi:hypothetical protein
MSLAECARRAHIPYATLQRWLYARGAKPGEKEPRLSDAVALAHALRTTVDGLFLGAPPNRDRIIRRILRRRG